MADSEVDLNRKIQSAMMGARDAAALHKNRAHREPIDHLGDPQR